MEIAQLEGHSFLKAAASNEDLLRSSAQNILDSYAHTWDLLAESLQNAVDAIELRSETDADCRKAIRIGFDCRTRSVEVTDTGVGMSPDQVYEVITPNRSLKRGVSAKLRGEKGVGLSFLVFACNHFKIETCDGTSTTSLEIKNANSWIQGAAFDQPAFSGVVIGPPQTYDGSDRYTRIWISSVPERNEFGDDVFSYTKERLTHVLRTRTAVGHTHPLFNHGERPPVDIEIFLK
jgi:molecular chaperone HtpG